MSRITLDFCIFYANTRRDSRSVRRVVGDGALFSDVFYLGLQQYLYLPIRCSKAFLICFFETINRIFTEEIPIREIDVSVVKIISQNLKENLANEAVSPL